LLFVSLIFSHKKGKSAMTKTLEWLKMHSWVAPFHEGLAQARDKKGKYFHVHLDGKPAYPQRFDWVGAFSQGLARACEDGKYFHIHINGKPAYPQRFDWLGPTVRGLTKVRLGSETFRITADGTRVD